MDNPLTPAQAAQTPTGLDDSVDLFDFDKLVASTPGPEKGAPVDVDALLAALDAEAAAAASHGADASVSPPAPTPFAQEASLSTHSSAARAPRGPESVQPPSAALPASPAAFARGTAPGRGLALALSAAAIFLALNSIALVLSWRQSEALRDGLGQLGSQLQAAVREQASPPVPSPAVHADPLMDSLAAQPEPPQQPARAIPALGSSDPDPLREQSFAEIERLISIERYAEARQQAYALLARCDRLRGAARELVEARASFLLGDVLRLEALAARPAGPREPAAPTPAELVDQVQSVEQFEPDHREQPR